VLDGRSAGSNGGKPTPKPLHKACKLVVVDTHLYFSGVVRPDDQVGRLDVDRVAIDAKLVLPAATNTRPLHVQFGNIHFVA
jgi:hypothetical protein